MSKILVLKEKKESYEQTPNTLDPFETMQTSFCESLFETTWMQLTLKTIIMITIPEEKVNLLQHRLLKAFQIKPELCDNEIFHHHSKPNKKTLDTFEKFKLALRQYLAV